MTALAADLGIGITTLQSLVCKHGWTPRSERMRDSPPALRLLEEAQALVAKVPPTPNPSPPLPPGSSPGVVEGGEQTPTATLPLSGGGSAIAPALTEPSLTPVERLEALVVKELEAEEAARTELVLRPRSPRRRALRAHAVGADANFADVAADARRRHRRRQFCRLRRYAEDMDAFRNELARRIRLFVESRRKNGRTPKQRKRTSGRWRTKI